MPMLAVFIIAASLLVLDKMNKLFDFVATEGGPVSIVFKMLANLLRDEDVLEVVHAESAVGRLVGVIVQLGGQTPLGLGLAYGVKYKGQKGSCLCYLGDGAVNQGCFHESLNLAALWGLGVVFVCEDNAWAISVAKDASTAIANNSDRAAAYGIPGVLIPDA